ncbi:MAG: hypothetical protein ACQEQL_06630, partial [Pseudomonadota bacterium]
MHGHFLIFTLALSLMLSACATKVTDPSDPRFDVSQFRFEDYIGRDITNIMLEIFPKGTDKKYIKKIFEGNMGLTPFKKEKFSRLNPQTKEWEHIESGNTYIYYYSNQSKLPF